MAFKFRFTFKGALLGLMTFAAASPAAQAAGASYDSLFPYYAEMCSASQYREVANTSADGGPYGHSVLFLKGACRVRNAEYPQLQPCDNGEGVGISTYFAFKNALWVATEGKAFFYDGGLKPNDSINEKTIDQAIVEAQSRETLKGVEMQDWIMDGKPGDEDVEHYRYRMSLGTDWALTYGRNVHCIRIPVSKTAMGHMVDHLNQLNQYYRNPATPYVWDLMTNNCTDTAHNTLAAIGAWDKKATGLSKFKAISGLGRDIAIPLNTLVDDLNAAFVAPPSYRALRFSPEMMTTLYREQWLLPQTGTLYVTYPIHTQGNTYFNTDSPLKAFEIHKELSGSVLEAKAPTNAAQLEAFGKNLNYTDLKTNLKWNLNRFSQALSSLEPNKSSDPREINMYNAYRTYLTQQLSESQRAIKSMN